ncbi:hypothetical protein HZ326_30480, partial [Fusarium oxysporum f. sp. albedinis]
MKPTRPCRASISHRFRKKEKKSSNLLRLGFSSSPVLAAIPQFGERVWPAAEAPEIFNRGAPTSLTPFFSAWPVPTLPPRPLSTSANRTSRVWVLLPPVLDLKNAATRLVKIVWSLSGVLIDKRARSKCGKPSELDPNCVVSLTVKSHFIRLHIDQTPFTRWPVFFPFWGLSNDPAVISQNSEIDTTHAEAETLWASHTVHAMSDHLREIERLQRENEELRREKEEAKAREEAERREKEEAKAREEAERREKEEAKAREEAERREKEEAKAREEAERREKEVAKAREEAERREKEAERRKNQRTTLEEYLYNCHFHLYKKLALADKSKSSTGFTKVEGKYYPKWLRPWTSFTNTQRQDHFEAIRRVCGERRLFHQESTTRDLGSTIHRKRAGNENAVDHFEKLAVEDPVWEILRPVWDDEELCKEYRCMGLRFSNNIRDFTQPSDGVLVGEEDPSEERPERRRRTGPNKRVASEQRVKPPPTKPDGAGVRTRLGGDESLAFVYDYKAAHKVALERLKPAVAKETLFMEVMERINSNKSLSDAELRGQDRAEELVAMALTQVFDYMVRFEVAYGYIAAGESLLFLHIDRANPQTLYCHPCVPDEDVGEASDWDWAGDTVSYTAAAQLASFCLLSLRSEALKGASLDAASRKAEAALKKWREPYDDAARLLGAED